MTETYKEYNETGDRNIFEDIIDKMILDQVAGMNETFRTAISKLPKDRKRLAILSLLDKDRNLFTKIKDSISNESLSKLDHVKDTVLMLREYVRIAEVEQKKFGEVMTPLETVKEMLATLPLEVWSNPDLKWLDPANGTGPYPIMVIYKLMKGLEKWEPNEELRYKHIIENMIYVCELQPKNQFLYLCTVDPRDEYSCNIYTGSFLDESFDKHMKEVWNLDKFDIVIGNPPYQEMDGGAKASAKPIYNLFTEKSIKISEVILFITPSRWFSGGKGLDSFRKMMMKSNKIKMIKHFDNACDIFGKTVEIKGGVSYFIYDKKYQGRTNINNNFIDLDKFDIIVNKTESISLISKILKYNNISLLCKGRGDNTFGIQTNDKRLTVDKNSENDIKVYVSKQKGSVKWINLELIKKHQDIHNYKVYTTEAAGKTGDLGKFGNTFIGEIESVCSGSYIWFPFSTEKECLSLKYYLETKFSKYLLSLRKISQHIKPDTLKWIPMVPFDREWTDEQLFEYFDLTEEEIELILNS